MTELVKHCDKIRKSKLNSDGMESSLAIAHTAENIRRIGAYAVDISETVIDVLV